MVEFNLFIWYSWVFERWNYVLLSISRNFLNFWLIETFFLELSGAKMWHSLFRFFQRKIAWFLRLDIAEIGLHDHILETNVRSYWHKRILRLLALIGCPIRILSCINLSNFRIYSFTVLETWIYLLWAEFTLIPIRRISWSGFL